jgi:hypothetical protein
VIKMAYTLEVRVFYEKCYETASVLPGLERLFTKILCFPLYFISKQLNFSVFLLSDGIHFESK